jgi:tRNA threonylcarbamoyladenosine biosynthesis protein TsaB
MTYILSIETATNVCSVALHCDGAVLGHQELFVEKSHSGLLTVIINDLTCHCGISLNELSAIAVSEGPGSYTGLRIGISTAKGLCYSLGIPLISVNTLEAMLWSVLPFMREDHLFCPMIDARRMEVYCLIADRDGVVIKPTHPKVISESSFIEVIKDKRIILFGDGALKCKEVLRGPNILFIDNILPNAKNIGQLALAKYANMEFEDVAYFEPFYLKDFKPMHSKSI